MKIIILIISFLGITFFTYSQQKLQYSEEVEEFMEEVYKYVNNIDQDAKPMLYLDYNRTKELALKMYNAIANDPAGYNNYISLKHKEWEDNVRDKSIPISTPRFGVYVSLVEDNIKNQLGKELLRLIKIPYFIRITITGKENKLFTDINDNISLPQVVIRGKINAIIKGNSSFNVNEDISFFYMPHWFQGGNCSPNFQAGKTYFVPLILTMGEDKVQNKLALALINDNSCSTYIIDNEVIYTPGDYFNAGEKSTWLRFKEVFSKSYLLQ